MNVFETPSLHARRSPDPATNARAVPIHQTTTSVFNDTAQPARWGMAFVFLLLGYEWLISGLAKMLSANFLTGLGTELRESMENNPHGWYVHFLERVVVPHARFAAALVEGGEILVALGMFLGAGLWISGDRLSPRWARTLHLSVISALAGSALMTANYFLMAGDSLPWIRPGEPFDEGLGIDGLLTLVAVALAGIQVLAMRATTASAHPRQQGTREPTRSHEKEDVTRAVARQTVAAGQ